MKLAIEGHSTQGSEVIARLEMLGGINAFNLNGSETNYYYYIDVNNKIYRCLGINPQNYIYYTLEEFLEKFPYKVGDKVQCKGATSCGSIFEVEEMRWEENTVKYTLCLFGCNYKRSTLPAEYLQPYEEENYCQVIGIGNDTSSNGINTSASLINEETMEEKDKAMAPILVGEDYSGKRFGYKIPNGYEFDCIKNNEIIIKPIKPKYPKTYEECCNVLGCDRNLVLGAMPMKYQVLINFQKLLICRDAYWKIAGEQMGLGKDWKPDWNDCAQHKFGLYTLENEIRCINLQVLKNIILVFPTEEMRDAFYENFKDLIEQCKELL